MGKPQEAKHGVTGGPSSTPAVPKTSKSSHLCLEVQDVTAAKERTQAKSLGHRKETSQPLNPEGPSVHAVRVTLAVLCEGSAGQGFQGPLVTPSRPSPQTDRGQHGWGRGGGVASLAMPWGFLFGVFELLVGTVAQPWK